MSDDRFVERLRGDARHLQYQSDDVAMGRLAARIRSRIAQPTVAELLAGWTRPLAASLSVLALVGAIGLSLYDRGDGSSLGGESVQVSVGGEVYSVTE